MWARLAALAALAQRALPNPSQLTCPSIRQDRFDCVDAGGQPLDCGPAPNGVSDAIEKNCVCCCGHPPRSDGTWPKSCVYEAPCCAADAIPAERCEGGRCEQYPDGLPGVTGTDNDPSN
eukprot:COSAG04_NODE_10559_length_769_cov_0.734328_2_plen_118_part_01